MESVSVDGLRVSSTAVRELLAAGELDGAARLLGRPYSISGRVVRGRQLGSRLGFPTANLRLKHNRPATQRPDLPHELSYFGRFWN